MEIKEKKLLVLIFKVHVFVAISDIKIKENLIPDFKKWFSESNRIISEFEGFVSRKLLETKDGKHTVLVEFKNDSTFRKMHQSPEHQKLHSAAISFLEKVPEPRFYKIVSE